MQNRYVGDIGDYVKLAILRALSSCRSLGVAWWLFSDESHKQGWPSSRLSRSFRRVASMSHRAMIRLIKKHKAELEKSGPLIKRTTKETDDE
jgi:hypothetical protein